jgi:hypothetical protein
LLSTPMAPAVVGTMPLFGTADSTPTFNASTYERMFLRWYCIGATRISDVLPLSYTSRPVPAGPVRE